MTHEEIINSMKDHTLGEYISLAVANDWPKVKICETMSSKFPVSWSTVSETYNNYIEEYGKVTKEDAPKKGGNPVNAKKVIYNGITYPSILKAAEANGMTKAKIKWELDNGKKIYIFNGKRYDSRKSLMAGEGFTAQQYEHHMRVKKDITNEWEFIARYV